MPSEKCDVRNEEAAGGCWCCDAPGAAPMPRQHGFLQYMPTFYCPRCDGAIAPQCVRGQQAYTFTGDGGRIMRVYCPHCDELFEATFRLAGGLLELEDGPHVVKPGRVRQRVLKEIGRTRGDVQLAAC